MSTLERMGGTAFLLGAGASCDAGLPTSMGLTRAILESPTRQQSETRRVLNYVAGVLIAEEGRRGSSPLDGVDVERIMSALELLAGRQTLELSPFVSAWDPSVEAFDRPSLGPFEADRTIESILGSFAGGRPMGAGNDMVRFIRRVVGPHGDGGAYRRALEASVGALINILATHEATDYLQPIFDLDDGSDGTLVATLNYDTTVEDHGREIAHPVETGIDGWAEEGSWNWGSGRRVVLMKLHGSVDWIEVRRANSTVPETVVRRRDEEHRGDPALIFGGVNKLRADGPFLELLAQWELQLQQRTQLVTVGYSFRDPHINHVIRRWINRSVDSRVVVIDPDVAGTLKSGFGEELDRSLFARLTLHLNRAREDRSRVEASGPFRLLPIAETARDGLPLAIRCLDPSNEHVWASPDPDGDRDAMVQLAERLDGLR